MQKQVISLPELESVQARLKIRRLDKRLKLFLVLNFSFLGVGLQSSKASGVDYWASILDRVRIVYSVTNEHVSAVKGENLENADQLQKEVVHHLGNDQRFAEQVRRSLRFDERVWVRSFSASMLIKTFKGTNTSDIVCVLSDPDMDVRGFGIGTVTVYKIDSLACALPSGLLSKDASERASATRAISKMMGWRGLPYYANMLYDADSDVAGEAVKAFESCKREDATPHLIRYLATFGKEPVHSGVTRKVIEALSFLHGKRTEQGKIDSDQIVHLAIEWIDKFKKEKVSVNGFDTNSPSGSRQPDEHH